MTFKKAFTVAYSLCLPGLWNWLSHVVLAQNLSWSGNQVSAVARVCGGRGCSHLTGCLRWEDTFARKITHMVGGMLLAISMRPLVSPHKLLCNVWVSSWHGIWISPECMRWKIKIETSVPCMIYTWKSPVTFIVWFFLIIQSALIQCRRGLPGGEGLRGPS